MPTFYVDELVKCGNCLAGCEFCNLYTDGTQGDLTDFATGMLGLELSKLKHSKSCSEFKFFRLRRGFRELAIRHGAESVTNEFTLQFALTRYGKKLTDVPGTDAKAQSGGFMRS